MDSMERRVRRLERMNWLLAVALLVVGGSALAMSQRSPAVVQTSRVEVVDAAGRVRMALGVGEDGPSFTLIDAQGVTRASLEDGVEGTALYIMDAAGDTRLGAAHFAHGGGGFALHGPETKGAAVLYLEGEGSLSFYGAEGDVLARFPEGG